MHTVNQKELYSKEMLKRLRMFLCYQEKLIEAFMKNLKSKKIDVWTAKRCASAGNRTRAARVAGEHSTTEPPMLT